MKKLLILPLLLMLTGCVTYYYPDTALEDGVYYAEDDPSYVVYSDPYAGTAYYPWASLDYFYLGYNPYPRYGFGYGYGAYGSGFSFGASWGFSPWYYPYGAYGYYSPWYVSHRHYSYYPAWRPHYGYCSNHRGCGHGYKNHNDGKRHDRYTGNHRHDRRNRSGEERNNDRYAFDRNYGGSVKNYGTSPVRHQLSTEPTGRPANGVRYGSGPRQTHTPTRPVESVSYPKDTVQSVPSPSGSSSRPATTPVPKATGVSSRHSHSVPVSSANHKSGGKDRSSRRDHR